jgi:hypothetical protein
MFTSFTIKSSPLFNTTEQFDRLVERSAKDSCSSPEEAKLFICSFLIDTSTDLFSCQTKRTLFCRKSAVEFIQSHRKCGKTIPKSYVDYANSLNDQACTAASNRNLPLIISISSVGVLMVVGGLVYYFFYYNRGMVLMECISSFHAKLNGECNVFMGDLVQIVRRDKEWVHVINLSQQNTKGMCPFECLLPFVDK